MALSYPDIIQHNNLALPIVSEDSVLGGVKAVTDETARNAIPIAMRKIGMLVSWVTSLVWSTKRFVGDTTGDTDWSNNANWQDIGNNQLTTDQLAAIIGAFSPSASNPFATMADIPLTPDEVEAIEGASSPTGANPFATMNDLPPAGSSDYIIVADVAARDAIASGDRKIGLIVSWIENTCLVTKKFSGSDITDAEWLNKDKWIDIDIPLVPSYNKEMAILKTDYCAWNAQGMTHVALRPQSYHYKGTYDRIYFVFMDWLLNGLGVTRSAPHNVNTTQVCFYDLDKKYFSPLTSIVHAYNTSTDGHDFPALMVTDDGHIMVTKEQLKTGGVHNSPIEIWRSNSVEDISEFTQITTLSKSGVLGFSYPTMMKNLTSGRIFMPLRGQPSGHTGMYGACSDNNGLAWKGIDGTANTPFMIASCASILSGPSDWYFYQNVLNGPRSKGYCIAVNLNEGPNGTSPDGTPAASRNKLLMYMYSSDGVTFGNAAYQFGTSGAFSKNVVTSGNITPAELLANFVVYDCSTIAHKSVAMREVTLSPEGIPYIMYSIQNIWDSTETPNYANKDNIVDSTKLAYFNSATSAWVINDISGIEKEPDDVDATKYSYAGWRPILIIHKNDVIDIIVQKVISKTDPYRAQKLISVGSEAVGGGIFKINTTTTDNFGAGLIAGDYFRYGDTAYTSKIDANNTLIPVETHVSFKRSLDKGVTWTEIREPLKLFDYLSNGNIGACSSNIADSGIVAIFTGIPRTLSGGAVLDHSDLCLIIEKIQPSNS
jgi:hypothetical protein